LTITGALPKEIVHLLKSCKVATLCCARNNVPHCFNCFIALVEDDSILVFKSSDDTEHVRMLHENGLVAGTVLSEKNDALNNSGMQFLGALVNDAPALTKARVAYYKRFPFAAAIAGTVFAVPLAEVMFSKTTLGIRTKIRWQRNVPSA
jgi:uncharacterized protein